MEAALAKQLLRICEKHVVLKGQPVVFCEPYLPFPVAGWDRWNRRLILSEAQNFVGCDAYLQRLRTAGSRARMLRLEVLRDEEKGQIGIAPWDDGTLKLAVVACWPGQQHDRFAVGNAVPWSLRSGRRNANPTASLRQRAIEFWKALLPILSPAQVVAVGKVAQDVMEAAGCKSLVRWTSASRMHLAARLERHGVRGSSVAELLRRFPQVRTADRRHPEWADEKTGYRWNKIAYACHAVNVQRLQPRGPE